MAKTIKDCRNTHQLTTSESDYRPESFYSLLVLRPSVLDSLFKVITDVQRSMKDAERNSFIFAAIDKLMIYG